MNGAFRGWVTTRLGLVAERIQTGPFGSQLHAEDYVDGGVPLINPSHIDEGCLRPSSSASVSDETAKRLARHRFMEGDIVFARRGELGRCAVIEPGATGWLCGTGSMLVRLRTGVALPKFVQLQASSSRSTEWLQLQSVGSTMDNLNAGILGRLPVELPSINVQSAVVAHLDQKTAAIDALIAKKERLIELLQEKRQALITQAVTKGLDPKVPMKDSGIEWLGEIPKHWDARPLRRLLAAIHQGWSPVAEDREGEDGEWGVLKLSAISKGTFKPGEYKVLLEGSDPDPFLEIKVGDVLLTRGNTPALVADVCLVRNIRPGLMLSDLVYRLVPGRLIHPGFLTYFLLSLPARVQIGLDARGSNQSMVKVSQGHIRSWVLTCPPRPEQERICEHLDAALLQGDVIVGRLRTQIRRIQEYRQALISSAVTGQLDISEEVAKEVEEEVH